MNRYQKTHDGRVIVEGPGGLYIDTAANFAADAGAAAPGVAGVVYVPGKARCVIDAEGNQGAGAPAAATLDALIARAGELVAAKAVRETPAAPSPAEIKAARLAEIDAQSVALVRAYIASKADAPAALKALENDYNAERVK